MRRVATAEERLQSSRAAIPQREIGDVSSRMEREGRRVDEAIPALSSSREEAHEHQAGDVLFGVGGDRGDGRHVVTTEQRSRETYDSSPALDRVQHMARNGRRARTTTQSVASSGAEISQCKDGHVSAGMEGDGRRNDKTVSTVSEGRATISQ